MRNGEGLFLRCWGFFLFDGNDLIDVFYIDLLFQSARPLNLKFVYLSYRAKAEVGTLIRTRTVTSAAEYIGALPDATRGEKNLCAHRVARAFRPAHKLQR